MEAHIKQGSCLASNVGLGFPSRSSVMEGTEGNGCKVKMSEKKTVIPAALLEQLLKNCMQDAV